MEPGIDYINLNEEQLKQLQREMLLLLLEVDRICKKYNIQYFLAYGTLIGAIRHKGFIPWDDDVDIQMFRKDYEKFCEVCETELNTTKFFLQNQKTDKYYNWVFGKLRLVNTSYVRAGQEHLKQITGICIDILPLDNMSSNKYQQKFTIFMCKLCRKILWAQVGKKNANNRYIRMLYKALSFIPRRLTIFIFELFAKLYNKKETSFLVSHNTFGQIYKRELYDETIHVEFERHTFRAPKGYDDILSSVYGDYKELPPTEERRGCSHSSYIKFLDGLELKL